VDWQLETGNWGLATGDWQLGTGNRKWRATIRKQDTYPQAVRNQIQEQTENAPLQWNQIHTPFTPEGFFREATRRRKENGRPGLETTQTNTNLTLIRPRASIGGDFTITRAVHDHDTDRLYVNGIRVLSRGGNLPALGGVTGAGTIGAGINGTYYDGEISEILVYDRVLSVQEAAQVESYLRNKYGTD
jgi:hypothetical protein